MQFSLKTTIQSTPNQKESDTMLKFYDHASPNPTKLALYLEEAGLPYKLMPVDVRKGEQHAPAYLAISPNGKTPALQDGDATLFDSNAILFQGSPDPVLPPTGRVPRKPLMSKFKTSKLVRRLVMSMLFAAPVMGAGLAYAVDGVSDQGISFTAEQAYPEGIAWSPVQKVFFVSSVHTGVIGKVTPQGVYTPFIQDDKLVASVGLYLDTKRNLLWAAIGDLGASKRSSPATAYKLAAVAAFDATTGERRAYHDLSHLVEGAHFANDLTVDAAGNVYVTDSFSPVIYRVDAKGRASVFAQSDLFKGEGFNLNGIVAHPDGYLLVAKYNSGDIFRISTGNGADIQRVSLPDAVKGADGLLLRDKNHLVVVENAGQDQVVELVSKDGWQSATFQATQKTAHSFPTTAAQVGQVIYVLNSRLDTLLTKDATKVSDYLLQKY